MTCHGHKLWMVVDLWPTNKHIFERNFQEHHCTKMNFLKSIQDLKNSIWNCKNITNHPLLIEIYFWHNKICNKLHCDVSSHTFSHCGPLKTKYFSFFIGINHKKLVSLLHPETLVYEKYGLQCLSLQFKLFFLCCFSDEDCSVLYLFQQVQSTNDWRIRWGKYFNFIF